MDMSDLIFVSVDDHLVEPADMFDGRMPAKYVDQAPRITQIDGIDSWEYLGKCQAQLGLNAVVGRPTDEWGMEPASFSEFRRGCYDVHERVKDMSANGVLGSLNFPSFPRFCGQLFTEAASVDVGLAKATVEAYNNWHIEAWAGAYPDRFIACSIPMLWDPELAAAEIRRVAAKGVHAVTFSMNPYSLGLPSLHSDHWDPFWAACEDTATVVCLHIGSDSRSSHTSPDAPMHVGIACAGIKIYPTAADLIYSQIFRKFPTLKVALAEGGIGWIPYFLERVDYSFQHHNDWVGMDLGGKLPSEVFKEHVITCYIVDEFGSHNLDKMNVDMVAWEADYPHSDCTWPNAPEQSFSHMSHLADDQINKITHENAMRLFNFNPFKYRTKEQSTVGALRAEVVDHDISIVSKGKKEQGKTAGSLLQALTPTSVSAR